MQANEGVEPLFGLSFGEYDNVLAIVAPMTLIKDPKVVLKVLTRKNPGRDGGISHIIKELIEGRVNSTTHQVELGGKIIHQHQTHIGKHGTQRMFPDEWVNFPKVGD